MVLYGENRPWKWFIYYICDWAVSDGSKRLELNFYWLGKGYLECLEMFCGSSREEIN